MNILLTLRTKRAQILSARALVFIIVLTALTGCFFRSAPQKPKDLPADSVRDAGTVDAPQGVTVALTSQNRSGLSGVARIADTASGLSVLIEIAGDTSDVARPAHIHVGSCATLGPVAYALESVVQGQSQTTIAGLTVNQLVSQFPLSVNVHKSSNEANVFVACGEIDASAIEAVGPSLDQSDATTTGAENGNTNVSNANDTSSGNINANSNTSNQATMNTNANVNANVNADAGTNVNANVNANTNEDRTTTDKRITVEGRNFSFSPDVIRVKKGDKVRIDLKSVEGFHDWTLDEFAVVSKRINTGEDTSVEFIAAKTGTFEYYCSVGSHRQLGMVGKLIVQ